MDDRKPDRDGVEAAAALDALSKRIDAAKRRQEVAEPKPDRERGAAMGLAFRLSVELVAGLVVGLLFGAGLDYLFGTAPWLLIIFAPLGLAAGVRNVIRTASEMNARMMAGDGDRDGPA